MFINTGLLSNIIFSYFNVLLIFRDVLLWIWVISKLSTRPWKLMREFMYRYKFSWPRYYDVVGGEWSGSRHCRFTPDEIAASTHQIGGWVVLRSGLDDVEKSKHLTIPWPRPFCWPKANSAFNWTNVIRQAAYFLLRNAVQSSESEPAFQRNI